MWYNPPRPPKGALEPEVTSVTRADKIISPFSDLHLQRQRHYLGINVTSNPHKGIPLSIKIPDYFARVPVQKKRVKSLALFS